MEIDGNFHENTKQQDQRSAITRDPDQMITKVFKQFQMCKSMQIQEELVEELVELTGKIHDINWEHHCAQSKR